MVPGIPPGRTTPSMLLNDISSGFKSALTVTPCEPVTNSPVTPTVLTSIFALRIISSGARASVSSNPSAKNK